MPNGYGFSDRVHHKVLFVKRLRNDRPGKLNRDHYESASPLDTNARATLPRKPCYAISGVSQHIFGDGGSCHGRSGWRPGQFPTRSSCSVPLLWSSDRVVDSILVTKARPGILTCPMLHDATPYSGARSWSVRSGKPSPQLPLARRPFRPLSARLPREHGDLS